MDGKGEEALISVIPERSAPRLPMRATGAVFGRCADMTGWPARRRKCPENVWRAAISREKSGVSQRSQGTDARPALLQGHQNR
jgi:hypothetical protein